MATIDSLANETLAHIMEMLKKPTIITWTELGPGHSRGRYRALRAAALVCSRWRDPAQRTLFDDVELYFRYFRRDERVLASPAQSRYRTRSLRVFGYSWDVALKVANVCDGLRTLHLFGAGVIEWTDLARPCFAGLQNFRFSKCVLSERAPEKGCGSLPTGLSSLGLYYTGVPFQEYPAAAFAALLSASKYTLKVLQLQSCLKEDDLSLLCPALRETEVGPNLKCLILNAPYRVPQGYIDLFPLFKSLESFSWHSYDVPNPLRIDDVENLRTILDAFPSPATLTHLSIGTDDFSSLEHILPLLGHPTLSFLTKLDLPSLPSLPSPTTVQEASGVAAMEKECEDRGIQWSMGGVVQ